NDVLSGGAPVNVAASIRIAGSGELLDERKNREADLFVSLLHGRHVEILQLRGGGNARGGGFRDQSETRLDSRQRGLCLKPRGETPLVGKDTTHRGRAEHGLVVV